MFYRIGYMDILIASHQPTVRDVLAMLLSDHPDITIVGQASSIDDMLTQLHHTSLDLILIEWDLLIPAALDTACFFEVFAPSTQVIAYGRRSEWKSAALDAGLSAFVWEGDGPTALLTTIRSVWSKANESD